MPGGTHEYILDPRNENVLIYINGDILPRPEAKVSVFDSGFLLGDGVWEGIRLHNGQLVFLEEHINRLYNGATSIYLSRVPLYLKTTSTISSKYSFNKLTTCSALMFSVKVV